MTFDLLMGKNEYEHNLVNASVTLQTNSQVLGSMERISKSLYLVACLLFCRSDVPDTSAFVGLAVTPAVMGRKQR